MLGFLKFRRENAINEVGLYRRYTINGNTQISKNADNKYAFRLQWIRLWNLVFFFFSPNFSLEFQIFDQRRPQRRPKLRRWCHHNEMLFTLSKVAPIALRRWVSFRIFPFSKSNNNESEYFFSWMKNELAKKY